MKIDDDITRKALEIVDIFDGLTNGFHEKRDAAEVLAIMRRYDDLKFKHGFKTALIIARAEFLAAALQEERDGKIPDGWKLVPVNPNKAMVDAAYTTYDAYEDAPEPKAWCGLASIYRAMIAAAPQPPAVKGEG